MFFGVWGCFLGFVFFGEGGVGVVFLGFGLFFWGFWLFRVLGCLGFRVQGDLHFGRSRERGEREGPTKSQHIMRGETAFGQGRAQKKAKMS